MTIWLAKKQRPGRGDETLQLGLLVVLTQVDPDSCRVVAAHSLWFCTMALRSQQ